MRVWPLLVVVIGCNAPEPRLSTTEQLAVVVGPPAHDFGSVEVFTSSAPLTFTLSPSGSGESEQRIEAVVGCDDFLITASLPADVFRRCGPVTPQMPEQPNQAATDACTVQTFQFTAKFAPTSVGASECVGVIKTSTGDQPFTMSGNGVPPEFLVAVSPRSINFGDIRVGDNSGVRTVTVENRGAAQVDLTVSLVTVPEIAMTKGMTGTQPLPKGASTLFDFVCTPGDAGTYGAVLTLDTQPNAETFVVNLGCDGIISSVSIEPSSFDVATLLGSVQPATVQLINEGPDKTVKAIVLDGTAGITITDRPADEATLVDGVPDDITIEYAPTDATPPGGLGSVTVSIDGEADRTIAISGEAKIAKVTTSPTQLDFGPVCAELASRRTVAVFAAGIDDLAGSFTVTGATTQAPFSLPVAVGQLTLNPPGDVRLNIDVEITPDAPSDTPLTGTLVVATTAPGAEQFAIPLSAQPLANAVTATPELSLGTAVVDDRSDAQPVRITNCSGQPVMIVDEPRFLGDHAADFSLIRDFQPTLIDNAETIELDVIFEPVAPGPRNARMEIAFTGGTTEVTLLGDAIGELDGRDTYYSCRVGGGATAWPMGVIVVVVLRRRRRN